MTSILEVVSLPLASRNLPWHEIKELYAYDILIGSKKNTIIDVQNSHRNPIVEKTLNNLKSIRQKKSFRNLIESLILPPRRSRPMFWGLFLGSLVTSGSLRTGGNTMLCPQKRWFNQQPYRNIVLHVYIYILLLLLLVWSLLVLLILLLLWLWCILS